MGGLVEEVMSIAILPGLSQDLEGGTDEAIDQEEEHSDVGMRLPKNLLSIGRGGQSAKGGRTRLGPGPGHSLGRRRTPEG